MSLYKTTYFCTQLPDIFLNQCPFFALVAIPWENLRATAETSPPVLVARSLNNSLRSVFSNFTNFAASELLDCEGAEIRLPPHPLCLHPLHKEHRATLLSSDLYNLPRPRE